MGLGKLQLCLIVSSNRFGCSPARSEALQTPCSCTATHMSAVDPAAVGGPCRRTKYALKPVLLGEEWFWALTGSKQQVGLLTPGSSVTAAAL
jgi:hypothetical protein